MSTSDRKKRPLDHGRRSVIATTVFSASGELRLAGLNTRGNSRIWVSVDEGTDPLVRIEPYVYCDEVCKSWVDFRRYDGVFDVRLGLILIPSN